MQEGRGSAGVIFASDTAPLSDVVEDFDLSEIQTTLQDSIPTVDSLICPRGDRSADCHGSSLYTGILQFKNCEVPTELSEVALTFVHPCTLYLLLSGQCNRTW